MSKKILIVDDEQDLVELLAKRLRAKDYEVFTAFNGETALALAKNVIPDLVILDLRLPDIYGTEVFERLKDDTDTKNVPVLILTGVSSPSEIVRNFELGAQNHLIKPVSPKVLMGEIEDILVPG